MNRATATPHRAVIHDLLRLAGFRRLLAVRYPSQVADGMFQVGAAGLLLFALDPFAATSALEVAELLAITALPFTVVGPLAGVLIDRWQRQRILVWSNLVRLLVVAGTLPLASRFAVGLDWGQTAFYVAVLVALSVNRFLLATLGAVLPRVVPGEALVPANAISSTGGSLMTLLGAVGGGAIAAAIGDRQGGPEAAVLVALLLYLASVVAALTFPARVLGPDHDVPVPPLRREVRAAFREVAEGIRLIAGARRAWAPIAAFSLLRAAITGGSIAGLLVLRNVFGGGSGDVSLYLAAFGVGVGVGAVTITILERTLQLRNDTAMRWALALTGVAIVVLAPGLRRPALLVMSGLMGMGFGIAKIASDTLVQGSLPDRLRGRLFAAYDVLVNLAVVGGGVLAALTLPTPERAEVVYLVCGLALLVGVIVGRRWLTHLPPPVDVETWDEAAHILDTPAT